MKDLEPERLNGPEQVEHSVFCGTASGRRRRCRFESWSAGCGPGQGDQLLPGAIGRVGVGGHGVKRESGFQLPDRLLVIAAARHEMPEIPNRQRQMLATAEYS